MNKRLAIIVGALAVSGTLVLAQGARSPEALFKAAQHTEEVQGNLKAAIEQYKKVVTGGNRALAAQALLRMAECHQKLGDAESRRIYEQLVNEFADQRDAVATARVRLARYSPAGTPHAKVQRQVWTGHGVDSTGSFSADGRYLSFTDWDTGDQAVRDMSSGINRHLTNTGGWVASGDYAGGSVVSPDGRQIAYAWFIEKENRNELRVISAAAPAGASPHTVMHGTDYILPFGWSPGGSHLFVLRSLSDKTTQIGVVSIQDGSYRSIKSLEWRYPDKASVSPDGTFIAYDVPAAENGSPRDIMLLAADGSRETAIVQGPANDTQPIWSADGAQVIFLSERPGNRSLWTVAVSGGRSQRPPTLLKGDIGKIRLLNIARNGSLYYNLAGAARQNVYIADLDATGMIRNPALASENVIGVNTGPAWSRDGQFLAYYSSRDQKTLVIKTTATGAERVVTLPAALDAPFATGPRWFPDNRAVLIRVRDAQGNGITFHRVSVDSGKIEPLWRVTQNSLSSFDISPDGRSIYAAFQVSGDPEQSGLNSGRLVRYDIDQQRETNLKTNQWFISVAVSPDGQQLAFLRSIRENTTEYPAVIEVMPSSGGTTREIHRDPTWIGGSRYNALAWGPDQKSLFFVRESGVDNNTLWRIPIEGGRPQNTGITAKARIKSLTVHPDGKRIAFGFNENDDNEIWTLENFPELSAAR